VGVDLKLLRRRNGDGPSEERPSYGWRVFAVLFGAFALAMFWVGVWHTVAWLIGVL